MGSFEGAHTTKLLMVHIRFTSQHLIRRRRKWALEYERIPTNEREVFYDCRRSRINTRQIVWGKSICDLGQVWCGTCRLCVAQFPGVDIGPGVWCMECSENCCGPHAVIICDISGVLAFLYAINDSCKVISKVNHH